jgi:hypothetical protein
MGQGQTVCGSCGWQEAPAAAPNNYAVNEPVAFTPMNVVWPILACFFALPPFSFIFLVYVLQGNSLFDLGRKDLAFRRYRTAKIWGWLSLGLSVAYYVAMFIMIPLYVAFMESFMQNLPNFPNQPF